MTDRTRIAQGPPIFSATMSPHRSLGPKGFLILMVGLGAVSFLAGLAFAWVGAWPVLGFFGLDVLLVYLAFKASYRSGRLYEQIDVDRERVALKRVHPSGESEHYDFKAYWARLRRELGSDGRTGLFLTSHGRRVAFAHFLTEEERQEIADEIDAALTVARRTPSQGE